MYIVGDAVSPEVYCTQCGHNAIETHFSNVEHKMKFA